MMEWVKASDRLPDMSDRKTVWLIVWDESLKEWCSMLWHGRHHDGFIRGWDGDGNYEIEATHWMIPEPPKSDQ